VIACHARDMELQLHHCGKSGSLPEHHQDRRVHARYRTALGSLFREFGSSSIHSRADLRTGDPEQNEGNVYEVDHTRAFTKPGITYLVVATDLSALHIRLL